MANRARHRQSESLLDVAVAELIKLIDERGSESASGDFGVLINLDRGDHRRVQLYEVRTVLPPTTAAK